MILKYLAAMWASLAPAMGNHLWQSTLVAITVALLTFTLRNNRAQTRYLLWLAASVKFLLPFSALVAMGSYLRWPSGSAQANPGLSVMLQEVSQPFSRPTLAVVSPTPASTTVASLLHLLPALIVVWLCGFLTVVFLRILRWRQISEAIRRARPVQEGREVQAMRRLEYMRGIRKPTEILLSRASLEPGIFGIVHPILVWPERITARLEDAHLDAIVAHELAHIRRRDNLAAAVHMLVEAIFWFHPLAWWLGARLVEERERACDEDVLESGHERKVYAESILRICEFCVRSPLTCVSGVTGSDLKKRVVRIMTERFAHELDFSKRLLLATFGSLALALPIVTGLLQATQSRAVPTSPVHSEAKHYLAFEEASVKENKSGSESSSMNVPIGPGDVYPPNGGVLSATNVPLVSFIYFAYDLSGSQFQLLLPQLPNWVVRDRFDIQARARGNPTKNEMRRMMQSLLAERFTLQVHHETQQLPVFALLLDEPPKTGPQLRPHPPDSPCSDTTPAASTSEPKPSAFLSSGLPENCGGIVGLPSTTSGRLRVGARNVPVGLLAATLPQIGNLDRAVFDNTGLNGTFDFTFEWTPQHSGPTPTLERVPDRLSEPGSTFVQDLKAQLGLKLESQNRPVEVFVFDHAEKPK